MFELLDPSVISVMLRGLLVLATIEEMSVLVVKSRIVANKVSVIRAGRKLPAKGSP